MNTEKYVNQEYDYAPFFLIFISPLHFVQM